MSGDAEASAGDAEASAGGTAASHGKADAAPTGVLVMAHGTPRSLDDLPNFVTEIRRGRPPEPQLLAELVRRYTAIGGTSPLAERTRWHADAIADALEAAAPGRFVVEIGYKFASPRIEDAVGNLSARGARRAVAIVLAPHYSAMSVGDYARRAEEAGASLERPVDIQTVSQWHLAPGFVPLVAELVRDAVSGLDADERAASTVLFTAHSLPARITETGDPYPEQLRQSADAIGAAADVERYAMAWQSAGRTADKWLEPDVLDVIADLPATGVKAVIVCPVGFVSEHLEVLYDLDVEAADVASRAGLHFVRTRSLDGDPRLAEILARVVLEAAGGTS